MKRLIILLLFLPPVLLSAQADHSIHYTQLEYFNKIGTKSAGFWRNYWKHERLPVKKQGCNPTKLVFGWHPYWSNGLEDNYRWDLLTDLAYFGAEISYSTGELLDTHGWETAAVVTTARANGVRVHLTAILFSGHDEFFASQSAQDTAIKRLVDAVVARGASGINLDFEGMGSDNRDGFTVFVGKLRQAMNQVDSNLILSIALPAVDWYGVFDIPNLSRYVDLFVIMGYDYYWSGSSEAGPVGQLYTLGSFNYTQTRSIVYYLSQGVAPERLLLGVPYYGRKWQTEDGSMPSATVSYIGVVLVKNMFSDYPAPKLDLKSRSQYYAYLGTDGNWYQVWTDLDSAMKYKYQAVLQTGIGGIGIWALGYDDGREEMWNVIEKYFSDCQVPAVDTLWDLGGPQGDYWDNEDYAFVLKTDFLTVKNINIELGYDTLFVYAVNGGNRNLLDALTGSFTEKTYRIDSGSFMLRMKTDGRTVGSGWTLIAQGAQFLTDTVSIADTIQNNDTTNNVLIRIQGVYPNPATNVIQLAVVEPGYFYTITDLYGNKLKTGFYTGQIDISSLTPGVYILKYYAVKETYVFKFIKY